MMIGGLPLGAYFANANTRFNHSPTGPPPDETHKEVIMIVGLPASGKSSLVNQYPDHRILNRDTTGGNLQSLLDPMREALVERDESIVLDNLNATVDTRKPFIELANELGVPVHCEWMTTSADDCQINALLRMYNRYGQVFLHPDDIKSHSGAHGDPNIFPISVIFHYKKIFEKPTKAEGFASINKVAFTRQWDREFKNRALFLDYDGTVRDVVGGEYKFPTTESEVMLLPNVKETLHRYADKGYMIFGVSNQSGIARGQVTDPMVRKCFAETNRQIGLDIPVSYCPHNVPPVCYCRKPQSGLAVPIICRHKINVKASIMVGDQTTDMTFGKRLGMQTIKAEEFFQW